MSIDGPELSDVVRQVRGELERAIWEGDGKDLRFRLGEVEVQLELVVTRATKPGGKIRLLVVDAEAKHERTTTSRNLIKLVLRPRLTAEPDQEPWVSGRAIENEK